MNGSPFGKGGFKADINTTILAFNPFILLDFLKHGVKNLVAGEGGGFVFRHGNRRGEGGVVKPHLMFSLLHSLGGFDSK